MRLLFIMCEEGVDQLVRDMLTDMGAPGYTRFTDAVGNGKRGPREGTPVWPGLNTMLLAAMPEEMVPEILDALKKLEAERDGRLAVKVFSVPAEEYC